jgi:hypothetical protein
MTILETKRTPWSLLTKARHERNPQQKAQCVCSIPCECGRSCIGGTGTTLAMLLYEYKHTLKDAFIEKIKLNHKHIYKENHRLSGDETRI